MFVALLEAAIEPWECLRLECTGDLLSLLMLEGESLRLVIELIRRKLRLSSLPFRISLLGSAFSPSSSDEGSTFSNGGNNKRDLTSLNSPVDVVLSPEACSADSVSL